jgi:hypothetical protein
MGIHGEQLKSQAGKIRTEAGGLTTYVTDTLRELAGLGTFWGDDHFGRIFADGADGQPGYRSRQDSAETDIRAIMTGYPEIASRLEKIADNVDTANWGIIISLPRVPG